MNRDNPTKGRPDLTEDMKRELLEDRKVVLNNQLTVTAPRVIEAKTSSPMDLAYVKAEKKKRSKYSGDIRERAIQAFNDQYTWLSPIRVWLWRLKRKFQLFVKRLFKK
jgi:hypothetical protein